MALSGSRAHCLVGGCVALLLCCCIAMALGRGHIAKLVVAEHLDDYIACLNSCIAHFHVRTIVLLKVTG